jgi:hypothetical protein
MAILPVMYRQIDRRPLRALNVFRVDRQAVEFDSYS